MKSLYKILFLIFFIIIALAAAEGSKAHAASACTLSAASIIFPPYDASVAVTSTGTLTITCSGNPVYTVSFGPSSGSGSVNPRALKRTAAPFDLLTYTITTPATTQGTPAGALWGNNTLGTIVVIEKYKPSGGTLVMTGTIPAGQDMTQGSYQDNITATITP